MNLTLSEAKEIKCGIINECPVSLECVVKSVTPLGSHDLFLAEVVQCHVDDNLIDDKGKIHFDKANLLTYAHGEYFGVNCDALGTFGYSVRKKTLNKDFDSKITSKHKKSKVQSPRDKKEVISKNNKNNIKSSTKSNKNNLSKKNKSKNKKRTRI